MTKVAILGAGITGLDIGWQLSQEGIDVTIIDKMKFVGGLAATINEDGYKMDIGPHYVALPNSSERINQLKTIIGEDEIKEIQVSVKVWFYGKIIDQYPTLYDVMFRYGIKFSCASISSFVKSKIKNKIIKNKSILAKDYCQNTYGKFLYNVWFKPRLVRKFGNVDKILTKDAEDMFPDVSSKKLVGFLKKRSSHIDLNVDYKQNTFNFYCENGMGVLAEKLKDGIEKNGGKILLDSNVISINHSNDNKSIKIEKNGEKIISTDKIVYAIPPQQAILWHENLPEKIGKISKGQPPANSIIAFLFIDSRQVFDGWIIDVFDPSLIFFRIAQQNYLSKSVVPKNKSLLSVEIRVAENDYLWNLEENKIIEKIKRDLDKMDLFDTRKIEGYKILKIPKIYPVFDPNTDSDTMIEFINSFKNEYTLGTLIADSGTLVTSKRKDEKVKNQPIGLTAVLQKTPSLINRIISEK